MGTEILSKQDAVVQFKKFGLPTSEKTTYLGRLYVRNGHHETGLGVCFMLDYRGLLTQKAWINRLLVVLNPCFPDKWKKNYVVYTRAFSGVNSRKARKRLMETTRFTNFDSPNISFMAAGSEWKMVQGRIILADVARLGLV